MNVKPFEQYESEVRSYCRSFPTVFVKASGSIITDENGKQYIDFFCGAGALNYGHNNTYIKERILKYIEKDGITHSLDMYTGAKREFISFFEDKVLVPRGYDYKLMFPGPTGTNGVEAVLKLARKVKKRSNVFAIMGAFHGMTLGALALTTDVGSRKGAGVPLVNVTHIPAPYMFPELDTIKYMETIITDDHSGVDKPAAVIIETTQAEGGIYVLNDAWLKALRELCDRHDILLIVDDVQVGCARTGSFFSFEGSGVIPDMVVLSKSIGGFGMPFAVNLIKPELDIWSPAEHNGTFRGNQLSMVAAKAGLEIMVNEKVERQVEEKAVVLKSFARCVEDFSSEIKVRGKGLIWGVDFSSYDSNGDTAKKVMTQCFDDGLIVERVGRGNTVVKVMPPLVIDEVTLKKGLDILLNAIKKVINI